MKYPTTRLRLSSALFWAAGAVCMFLMLSRAADTWIEFQATRAAVADQLGRMP